MNPEERRPKIGVVCAYFGPLPSYFGLFAYTCGFNDWIDWHVFTDQPPTVGLPENVHFHRATLGEIRDRAELATGTPICLPRPYKLCDLKPAYGLIFEPELRSYDFWGHGDCDVIAGTFANFLSKDDLSAFDKIYNFGHFSLYRNTEAMRHLFTRPLAGPDYRDVFRDPVYRRFDECEPMATRLSAGNVPFCDKSVVADVDPTHHDIRIGGRAYSPYPRLLVWDSGRVYMYRSQDGATACEEFAYAHLQKRRMEAPEFPLNGEIKAFAICPSRFLPLPGGIPPPDRWNDVNPRRPLNDFAKQAFRPLRRLQRFREENSARKAAGYRRSR